MVEISEDEFREYIYLKKKEEIRQQEIKKMMQEGTPSLEKWRRDIYSPRGLASVFANVLQKEYDKRGKPDVFVLCTWRTAKKYLKEVIKRINGKITIDKYFRTLLKRYGWALRIDRKFGILEVEKII